MKATYLWYVWSDGMYIVDSLKARFGNASDLECFRYLLLYYNLLPVLAYTGCFAMDILTREVF